jgi:hypothetical protein
LANNGSLLEKHQRFVSILRELSGLRQAKKFSRGPMPAIFSFFFSNFAEPSMLRALTPIFPFFQIFNFIFVPSLN